MGSNVWDVGELALDRFFFFNTQPIHIKIHTYDTII